VHETPNANGHDGLVVKRLSARNRKDAVSNAALLAIRLANVPFFLHNILQLELLNSLQKMLQMLSWKILKPHQSLMYLREKPNSCAKSLAGVTTRLVTKILAYL